MATSQNGWTAVTSSAGLEPLSWITGRVLPGDVHRVFDHLCARFHAEVEPIVRAHSWGWAYREIRGTSTALSNHASATAIDLNAPKHPIGKRGTFTPGQQRTIRAILTDLGGVVRWGGDYTGRPDDMHFEINADAAAVNWLGRRLNGQEEPVPTLSSPMQGRFTSGYNPDRWITYRGRRIKSPHLGVDIAPPVAGTPRTSVHAPESGTVTRIVRGRKPGQSASSGTVIYPGVSGDGIRIRSAGGRLWVLGHVDVDDGIRVGQRVRVGQRIGAGDRCGVTDLSGTTTGYHVHVSLITHGRWTNPEPLFTRARVRIGEAPRASGSGGTARTAIGLGPGDTRKVQGYLNNLGYGPLVVDGVAGEGGPTARAVRRFKSDRGLPKDSVWGTGAARMYRRVVRGIQEKINRYDGPSATSTGKVVRVVVDGDYGRQTQQAVLDLQQAHKRARSGEPDAVAGPRFLAWLNDAIKPKPEPQPSGAPYGALRVDGDDGTLTWQAWQHVLDYTGHYDGRIDGEAGEMTRTATQRLLRDRGFYDGRIDGDLGEMSNRAWQSFLAARGFYTGRIDGRFGDMSVKALQSYLNDFRTNY